MSFGNYEESGYDLVLDMLTVLYRSCVSCPRRSGLVVKSNHLRPICLIQLLLEGAMESGEQHGTLSPTKVNFQKAQAQISLDSS